MVEILAILLTVGCILAGGWLLLAAGRGRSVVRLARQQRHMQTAIHVHAALVFFFLPVLMYHQRLHWAAIAVGSAVLFGAAIHLSVLDLREQRRRRNGPLSAFGVRCREGTDR